MSADAGRIADHIEAVVDAAAGSIEEDHQAFFHQHLHHAFTIADVDDHDVGRVRMAAAKRAAMRLMRPVSVRQSEFNRSMVAAVSRLSQMLDETRQRFDVLEGRLDRVESGADDISPATRAAFASYDTILGDLSEAHDQVRAELAQFGEEAERNHRNLVDFIGSEPLATSADVTTLTESLSGVRGHIHELAGRVERGGRDLSQQRARLELVLRSVKDPSAGPLDAVAEEVLALRESELYAAFEQRFRGSREDVLEMLSAYEADLQGLDRHGPVVDIGSGRAEWLELVASAGLEGYGVDTNPAFVAAAEERGLDLRLADGIAHLSELPPSSIEAVTAFHVIEHLTIPAAEDLLRAAFTALKPGGLLIVETPNPSNLVVGSAAFWLDPTHLRPVHPDLLAFLVEHHGFGDIEVRFLHPARDMTHRSAADDPDLADLIGSVEWALFGPQDYAVVAHKPGGKASADS